jgi:O-acetyl-ADP-ribose deacetylase
MAHISPDEIPTLGLLYESGGLDASPLPFHDATSAFNDQIAIYHGDITTLAVDAIVNAANTSLCGGGGVDGAIHRAAGEELLTECKTLGGCETGHSKITDAYRLPCRKIIHAVGPIYNSDSPSKCRASLQCCYQSALELAVRHELKSIAFCAISTGIYGYPSYDAATATILAIKAFLESENGKQVDKVIFVTFVNEDFLAYRSLLP